MNRFFISAALILASAVSAFAGNAIKGKWGVNNNSNFSFAINLESKRVDFGPVSCVKNIKLAQASKAGDVITFTTTAHQFCGTVSGVVKIGGIGSWTRTKDGKILDRGKIVVK